MKTQKEIYALLGIDANTSNDESLAKLREFATDEEMAQVCPDLLADDSDVKVYNIFGKIILI